MQLNMELLQLSRAFVFDPYVKSVPVARTSVSAGTLCQVSGWGHLRYVCKEYIIKSESPCFLDKNSTSLFLFREQVGSVHI